MQYLLKTSSRNYSIVLQKSKGFRSGGSQRISTLLVLIEGLSGLSFYLGLFEIIFNNNYQQQLLQKHDQVSEQLQIGGREGLILLILVSESFIICSIHLIQFLVVGSGPAGLFTAKKLLNEMNNISVHIYEKDPVPTGLIRYGMAPDHEKIKRVADELLAIHKYPGFKLFQGVEIGQDIRVRQLQEYYSAVIFAYGAQEDKQLNIPGEELEGIYSGRSIVNWYNSVIDYQLDIDFSSVRDVVIIGNGNVAMDLCRVLGQSENQLKATDINIDAMKIIDKKQIKNFFIVGRRGAVQSSFSLKEMRELSNIEGIELCLYRPDIVDSSNESSLIEAQDWGEFFGIETRANRRKMDFMKTLTIIEDQISLQKFIDTPSDKIRVIFRFLLNPVQIEKEGDNLSISFQQMKLEGAPFKQSIHATGAHEKINCQMIIKSVGYRSVNIDDDLMWDEDKNILKNSHGCLQMKDDPQQLATGLYAAGWVKTGPVGVVDQTFNSSRETIVNLTNHIKQNLITPKDDPYGLLCVIIIEMICRMLKFRQIQFSNFEDWKIVDEFEKTMGKNMSKKRLKINTRDEIKEILSANK